MSGFLDPKERVIDIVFTGTGKRLLSRGDLHITYWIPFDDEVDYDPFISTSSSLNADDLRVMKIQKTEDPLVREASSGYRNTSAAARDTTNVSRPLFTVPNVGSSHAGPIPRACVSTSSLTLTANQKQTIGSFTVDEQEHMVDRGIRRYGASTGTVKVGYTTGSFPTNHPLEGFLLTVYESSSVDGYVEVLHNRDSNGEIVFNQDLKLVLDEE